MKAVRISGVMEHSKRKYQNGGIREADADPGDAAI
jgi:hypothetical protein